MDAAGGSSARIARSLAASMLERVPELTDVLVETIRRDNPGYLALNVVPDDDLWRSCHDNVTRVVQLVAGAADHQGPDGYFDAARATGRRRAEQRMPLDDVLRSYRLGGRLVWEGLIDRAREAGTADGDALLDVGTRVWEVVDTISAQVAAAYHAAERQLVRADEQRKAALWEGLLRGRAQDLAFAYEAARIVELPVDGPYLAVATELPASEVPPVEPLRRGLSGLGVQSAWQARASALVGLLALGESPLGSTDLAGVSAVLAEHLPGPVGLSLRVSGLAEADVAYRQAMLALRTVPPTHSGVVPLEDRLPEAVLLGSSELAGRLMRLWLGPILALPAEDARLLLDTLDTWLANGGSTSHTAEAMHCHRNTVINRLHRVRAVIGRDLLAEPPPLELALALRAVRLFA